MIKLILAIVTFIILGLSYYMYSNHTNEIRVKTAVKTESYLKKSKITDNRVIQNSQKKVTQEKLILKNENTKYQPDINKTLNKDFSEKEFSNAEANYRTNFKRNNFEINPKYKNDKIPHTTEYAPNENLISHKSLETSEFREKESNSIFKFSSDSDENYEDKGFDL